VNNAGSHSYIQQAGPSEPSHHQFLSYQLASNDLSYRAGKNHHLAMKTKEDLHETQSMQIAHQAMQHLLCDRLTTTAESTLVVFAIRGYSPSAPTTCSRETHGHFWCTSDATHQQCMAYLIYSPPE